MAHRRDEKSLMRSLGEFVGHIWRGVSAPVEPTPRKAEVRRTVEECEGVPGPGGEQVILRRTTIDEVEIRTAPGPTSGGAESRAPERG